MNYGMEDLQLLSISRYLEANVVSNEIMINLENLNQGNIKAFFLDTPVEARDANVMIKHCI